MMTSPNLQQKMAPLEESYRNQHSQQLNMSDIAARLRLVRSQMHDKLQDKNALADAPFHLMMNETNDSADQWQAVHERLDEISHAILAEHYARRQMQEKLLHRLERIEQAKLKELHANHDQSATKADLLHELEKSLTERLQSGFDKLTTKLAADIHKSKDEVFRQLREVTAATRYSPQLAALERQINQLQSKLNQETSSAHPVSAAISAHTENDLAKQNGLRQSSNDTENNTPEKFDALGKVVQGLMVKKCDNVMNTHSHDKPHINMSSVFDAKKSGEMIAMVRQDTAQKQKTVSEVGPIGHKGAKMTRILAVALMLVVVCGLYMQFKGVTGFIPFNLYQ